MAKLHPVHFSVAGKSRRPNGMERIAIPVGQVEALERVALEIFSDMSNAGHPFSKALGAIYLSGLENGAALERDKT